MNKLENITFCSLTESEGEKAEKDKHRHVKTWQEQEKARIIYTGVLKHTETNPSIITERP